MGIHFGFNRSSAFKRVQEYLNVLELSLKRSKSLPAESLKTLRKIIGNEKLVIIDDTEQRKNRPKNKKKQKEYYSGKKTPYGEVSLCGKKEHEDIVRFKALSWKNARQDNL